MDLDLIRALMDCSSSTNPAFPTVARLTLCLCANIASREPRGTCLPLEPTHPPQRAEATLDTVEQNLQNWPAARLIRPAALLSIWRLIDFYRYRGATLCMKVSYTLNSCNIFSRAGWPIDALRCAATGYGLPQKVLEAEMYAGCQPDARQVLISQYKLHRYQINQDVLQSYLDIRQCARN